MKLINLLIVYFFLFLLNALAVEVIIDPYKDLTEESYLEPQLYFIDQEYCECY